MSIESVMPSNHLILILKTVMGKKMKKNVHICITESLCCTAEINIVNQRYFNKTFLKRRVTPKDMEESRKNTKRRRVEQQSFSRLAQSHHARLCYAMLCYAKSLQSCPTLCDPIDGSPPGSSIHGILQARTLEWVAISFSNA